MGSARTSTGPTGLGEADFAKMMNWPRQLLAIQTAVSAADHDIDRVIKIVLQNALRLVPGADGGEIELREGHEFVCRTTFGMSSRTAGMRTPVAGIVPAFCSITAQDNGDLRSSISAPIPFEGQHVGVLRLHSLAVNGFSNRDLLALQLLTGLITHGLGRYAQVRGEQARIEADRRFKATFEQAAVGIAHVSPDGHFIMVNDKFCDIAGWQRDELMLRGFQGITHPDDLDLDLANAADLLSGKGSSYSMEKRYLRSDGSIVWVNLTVALIRDAEGNPDFFVSVVEDISARRAAESDAEQDSLTGLLNRRGVLRKLEWVMREQGPWRQGVAAAFIDLNGFKAVNDGYGHEEGDRCLNKIAAALRKALRNDDVIARLGGDEFLALFPATDETHVRDVLDRLQREILTVSQDEPWAIGASLGVAIVPAGAALDPTSVIATADRLMYRAKHSQSPEPLIATVSIAA